MIRTNLSLTLVVPYLLSYAPKNIHSDVIGSEIKVRRKIGSTITSECYSTSELSCGNGMLDGYMEDSYSTFNRYSIAHFETRIKYEKVRENLNENKYYFSRPKVGSGFYNYNIFGVANFLSDTAPTSLDLSIHMANAVSTDNLGEYNSKFADDSHDKFLDIKSTF